MLSLLKVLISVYVCKFESLTIKGYLFSITSKVNLKDINWLYISILKDIDRLYAIFKRVYSITN